MSDILLWALLVAGVAAAAYGVYLFVRHRPFLGMAVAVLGVAAVIAAASTTASTDGPDSGHAPSGATPTAPARSH